MFFQTPSDDQFYSDKSRSLSVQEYVAIISDSLKLQKNVCLARYFDQVLVFTSFLEWKHGIQWLYFYRCCFRSGSHANLVEIRLWNVNPFQTSYRASWGVALKSISFRVDVNMQ